MAFDLYYSFLLLLSYDNLSRKPLLFKSFTGLSVKQFDDIYCHKEIEVKYSKHEIKRLSSKRNRERDIGGGRHFKLVVKDRVIMVLVYYRLYITYTLMEFLFGLDQSNVCRGIQKIESLIRKCLPIPQKLYNVPKRLKTMEEIEVYFPGFMAFVDCTEQQIPRPKNKKRKKMFYSGKKKIHAVKNLYIVNEPGLIIYKTKHKQIGKKHDYKIYKKNHPDIPKEVVSMFDLGFLGVQKDFPEQKSCLPIKRKKNQILTEEEEEYNKNHS
ncbi:MAG: transposase, partial [Candidatus Nitrosocosmicus sp.]|nr:transposase [Candidatus Nitrosocosmicus sp.]